MRAVGVIVLMVCKVCVCVCLGKGDDVMPPPTLAGHKKSIYRWIIDRWPCSIYRTIGRINDDV